MCTAKLFQSNIRSIIQYDAGRLHPKVFVNCRVQGTCCSFRIFSYGPLPDYCMSVPRWWELAQFISKKCDSVCTDWMKVVDCIVLSGAHLLAVTSLGDSPTASTQRGCVGVHLLHMQPCSPVGLHLLAARQVASPDVSLILLALMRSRGLQLD